MGIAETRSAKPRNVRPPGKNMPAAGQHWPAADPRKRLADVTLAGLLLILLLPLLLLIVGLIRLDRGPALFRQTRVGAGGVPFTCLKFRTMRANADLALLDYLAGHPQAAREWAENCKLRDDPRATRLGRLLRSLSLDELPQLLNVLRGEMSLVGPRPIVADEVARYGSAIDYYYRAKPGLTGLWQVSGRSDLPYARRVELDVDYVRHQSLWLDLVILYRTFGAVLRRRGAR
jgi:lipopolysaccharide/colanic/teichoic acid biosynthesis glycosyltransferase